MDVKLNKTIKWKGKFVKAGNPIDATQKEADKFKKDGLIGQSEKFVPNDAKFKELTEKVKTLESQIKDGGDKKLISEIETLKSTIGTKDTEIETLKSEVEILQNDAVDLTQPKDEKKK